MYECQELLFFKSFPLLFAFAAHSMKTGLLWWMKKGPACSLPWQLVSLVEVEWWAEMLGEQRGSGSGFIAQGDAVMFCVLLLWSITVVCLSWAIYLEFEARGWRIWLVACQVNCKELGNVLADCLDPWFCMSVESYQLCYLLSPPWWGENALRCSVTFSGL